MKIPRTPGFTNRLLSSTDRPSNPITQNIPRTPADPYHLFDKSCPNPGLRSRPRTTQDFRPSKTQTTLDLIRSVRPKTKLDSRCIAKENAKPSSYIWRPTKQAPADPRREGALTREPPKHQQASTNHAEINRHPPKPTTRKRECCEPHRLGGLRHQSTTEKPWEECGMGLEGGQRLCVFRARQQE